MNVNYPVSGLTLMGLKGPKAVIFPEFPVSVPSIMEGEAPPQEKQGQQDKVF
jgi:hypothetical protein